MNKERIVKIRGIEFYEDQVEKIIEDGKLIITPGSIYEVYKGPKNGYKTRKLYEKSKGGLPFVSPGRFILSDRERAQRFINADGGMTYVGRTC